MRKIQYKYKIKICPICQKEFQTLKDCKSRSQIYCSRKCYRISQQGKKPTKKQLEGLKKGRYKGKKIGGWKWSIESKRKASEIKKGIKLSISHRQALSKARIGKFSDEKHPQWKGDKVGYFALHDWIRKKLGIPKKCSLCGKLGRKNGRNWSIHWANKSGEYKRNLFDWIALCVKCHKKYDFKL